MIHFLEVYPWISYIPVRPQEKEIQSLLRTYLVYNSENSQFISIKLSLVFDPWPFLNKAFRAPPTSIFCVTQVCKLLYFLCTCALHTGTTLNRFMSIFPIVSVFVHGLGV